MGPPTTCGCAATACATREPLKTERGQRLTLQVENARTPQEAAKIYPANYWLSLYQPPPAEELPLVDSEGVSPARAQVEDPDEESSEAARAYPGREHWVGQVKLGCMLCHQMGQEITRLWTRPEHWDAVWERAGMKRTAEALGKRVLRNSLADWGTRIAAGEVPPAPPRPAGVERNMVDHPVGRGRARTATSTTTSRPTSATRRCIPTARCGASTSARASCGRSTR